MSNCSYDPRTVPAGAPIGMFHCPECGEMVIAGMEHPDPDWELTEEDCRLLEELNNQAEAGE